MRRGAEVQWRVHRTDRAEPLGGLRRGGTRLDAEPGAWGHGYATEAARACLDWGFATLDTDRLTSMIRPGNTASVRVAERLGFTPCARAPSSAARSPSTA
ncbi:GNAT family N-acetyltransferase, partial [Streptomyces griseolus]|uniref:GNAT family N-acetyltransferase n=1 Tax=Streptomyces griseolus TaxID=1909 RepID=UPI002ADE5C75